MPIKRRLDKSRRLDEYRLQQLLEGPDATLLAGVGYLALVPVARFEQASPEDQAAMLAEMRRDWEAHGSALMEQWRAGDNITGGKPWVFIVPAPDELPWAAEQFGLPA